jgi:hypothetical protein
MWFHDHCVCSKCSCEVCSAPGDLVLPGLIQDSVEPDQVEELHLTFALQLPMASYAGWLTPLTE